MLKRERKVLEGEKESFMQELEKMRDEESHLQSTIRRDFESRSAAKENLEGQIQSLKGQLDELKRSVSQNERLNAKLSSEHAEYKHKVDEERQRA